MSLRIDKCNVITLSLNLYHLNLPDNALIGNIPSEIGELDKLEVLYLNQNQLSGEIPISIYDLSNLNYLSFTDNQLTGGISKNVYN